MRVVIDPLIESFGCECSRKDIINLVLALFDDSLRMPLKDNFPEDAKAIIENHRSFDISSMPSFLRINKEIYDIPFRGRIYVEAFSKKTGDQK